MRTPKMGNRRRAIRARLLAGVCLLLAVAAASVPSPAGARLPDRPDITGGAGAALEPDRLAALGLERAPVGFCKGGFRTIKTKLCTHGPDPAPVGVDVNNSRAVVVPPGTVSPRTVPCVGNGSNGWRVQVIYARAPDVTDRFNQVLATLRQAAEGADAIYNASAGQTGGSRRIRFVHDSSCNITVARANMDQNTDDDNFDNTVADLQRLGFNRTDRKYMVFVDASVAGACGQGGIRDDDQAGPDNLNNGGASWGLNWCWNASTAAHELMHNLGGVQHSAPQATGGWHCWDDNDVMCYQDSPTAPPLQVICTDAALEQRFDCNDDDYYSTNPGNGNYLRDHWNVTNSMWLTGGPRWGYVWADQPSSASYTPFSSYQRNSGGASNTITRSGTGAYTVRFTNVGGSGGIVNVTAYDSSSTMCKVSSLATNGSNREAGVRCFTATGSAADSLFTASFTRPLNNPGDFGYVRADQPTTASYTPSSDFRFNSTGGTNTVTRESTGNYTVRMPGLGATVGGTVLVTAFGTDSSACKVVGWSTGGGTTLFIAVRCHNTAGNPVDSRYTVTYAQSLSTLGVTGARAGYVWAHDPTSASYTPVSTYQFNSAGGTNTVTRHGTGDYTVNLPGLGADDGHVQVTAYGNGADRCKVGGWFNSGGSLAANVRCFTPAGNPVDTLYTLSYTR